MKCDIGAIVQSKAGRDKDDYFIVIGKLDNDYCLIADGKNRKLSKPKKKKIKHLIVCREISELKERLEQAKYILDSHLRIELKNFLKNM